MANTSSSETLLFPSSWSASQIADCKVALLTSGGVESAILIGLLPDRCKTVQPIYVRFGLLWEEAELYHLRRYLRAVGRSNLLDLKVLEMPIEDLYKNHWSTTGDGVPDASTDDDAVYLPGRNILLTAKTAVWCALNNTPAMALGSLATNPFPDATDPFFEILQQSYSTGLAETIQIIRPVVHLHKEQALRLAKHLPLELSFSCIKPQEKQLCNVDSETGSEKQWIHCGACNKCEERRRAFELVDFPDRTEYASDTDRLNSAASNLCIR